MVRLVGGVAAEPSCGGMMVCGVEGSGYVWGGGVDSRRRLRGGGLILSEEDIFREVENGSTEMIHQGFCFDCILILHFRFSA